MPNERPNQNDKSRWRVIKSLWDRLKDGSQWKKVANDGKGCIQMCIGLALLGAVGGQFIVCKLPFLNHLRPGFFCESESPRDFGSLFALVGMALAYSSAVELVYTFFTPSLDEAVNPLITGVAATILLLASQVNATPVDPTQNRQIVESIGILVLALVGLFIVKRFLLKDE